MTTTTELIEEIEGKIPEDATITRVRIYYTTTEDSKMILRYQSKDDPTVKGE